MTLLSSSSLHTVTDARQAAILSEPETKRYFVPFLGRSCTVKEAATEVGCALNTMLYRVKQFQKAGLLHVVEVRKRAGRPVKVYRSVHDGYFVPFTATPFVTLSERVRTQGQPWFTLLTEQYARVLQEHEHAGNEIFRLGEQVITTDLPPRQVRDGRPVLFQDAVLHLLKADADKTAAALQDAFKTGEGKKTIGQRYLLIAALIPLLEE